jgi:hypothetical protein
MNIDISSLPVAMITLVIINIMILAFELVSGTQEDVIRRYGFIPDHILSVPSTGILLTK